MIPFLEPQRELRPTTFAEPSENVSFGERLTSLRKYLPENIAAELGSNPQAVRDLFMPAERQTMLVDTLVSSNIATEQAYDRRIAAVKAATGVELENPLRGGYGDQVKRAARDAVRDRLAQEGDEPPENLVTGGRIFDEKLAELRDKHPDKLDALTFGDVRKEAEAIAKGSDQDYEAAKRATPLTPGAALVTEFGGAMWGQRRDPLFVGSLFAGPTSAVGKTVAARIATSSLFQGFYNAGISALEQPAVQQWRSEIGVKSGVMPAVENVGMAFLFGVIPGAALRGLHELGAAERLAVRRVMDGAPEPGDLEKVAARFGEGEPVQAQAIRLGEEMDDAAKITMPRPPKEMAPEQPAGFTTAKGSTYELHDDGTTTRTKAARSDPGHEGDSGLKDRTERTVYVDNAELASALSAAGLQNLGSKGVRVIVEDGKASLLTWNEQAGRWGRSKLSTDIPISDTPAVGKAPLELWKKADDVPGYEAYRGMHAGNAITEMRPRQPPRYKDGITPELHDDLVTAAQRHADDPINQPSPEGVAVVERLQAQRPPPPAPEPIKYNPLEMARRGELTADRAVQIADEMKTLEKEVVDAVLGSDAEAWRTAHKRSDRAWDNARDAEAKKQDQIIADIEAKYPPDAIERMYRTLEQGEHTDPQGWRDFARDLREVEGDRPEAVVAVAYTLRRLPEAGKAIAQHDRETLALIQHALDQEAKRGGDPEAFLKDAFRKSAERYGGGPDAAEIIASDMERLRKLLKNPPPDRTALPAPKSERPMPPEITDHITAARPETLHDAQMAASEALEDIGNRDTIARTRAQMENDKLPTFTLDETFAMPRASSKDPLDKIPMARDDGAPTMVSHQQAARAGERETKFADIIRECK